jgi:hypothetical protein
MPPASSVARLAPASGLAVFMNAMIMPCTVPSRPSNGVTVTARVMGRTLA